MCQSCDYGMPFLPAGGGLYKFPLPTVGNFLPGLRCILEGPLHPLPLEVASFHSFCWTSGLHSFSLTQYQIRFPSPPNTHFPPPLSTFLPRSLPSSALVIAFFSPPSGTEASSFRHLSLLTFEFCGLYLGYSVLYYYCFC